MNDVELLKMELAETKCALKKAQSDYELSEQKLNLVKEDLSQMTRLREIALDAAGIAIWTGNTQTEEMQWDSRIRKIFGFDEDVEPSNELWATHLHPDDKDRVLDAFANYGCLHPFLSLWHRPVLPKQ